MGINRTSRFLSPVKALGAALGEHKVELPPDSIARMDLLKASDPAQFHRGGQAAALLEGLANGCGVSLGDDEHVQAWTYRGVTNKRDTKEDAAVPS